MRRFPSLPSVIVLLLFVGPLRAQETPAPPPVPAATPAPPTTAAPGPSPEAAPPEETDSATMETSFDFSQGVILLDVDLSGGHVAKLALDLGEDVSVLDGALAEQIKLPFDSLPSLPGGKGPDISVPQIAIGKAVIGNGSFLNKPFMILSIAPDLKTMGITCQGTIGYRFFEDQVIQIDYRARKLRKLREMPPAPEGATVLSMQWKPYHKDGVGVLTTDQFKLGDQALVAQFDTLFARTLLLFTTRLPGLESRRLPELPSAYYENGILRAAQPTQSVALAGHRLEPTPPAYLADKDARLPDTDIAAVLGNLFFLDAVVTLDYKKDQWMIDWKK